MVRIIDYKAGNAPSVLCAVTHIGYDAALAHEPNELMDATHIILPGVGSAGATMQSLHDMGMISVIEEAVLHKKTLFLGVCVGMQILFEYSEEESADCLGWLKGRIVKFDSAKGKVPQMGWNKVHFVQNQLTKNMQHKTDDDYFYFVNSYYAKPENASCVWGIADYHGEFTAAVCKENIYATQFHIEKSGAAGLELLHGFLSLQQGGDR